MYDLERLFRPEPAGHPLQFVRREAITSTASTLLARASSSLPTLPVSRALMVILVQSLHDDSYFRRE